MSYIRGYIEANMSGVLALPSTHLDNIIEDCVNIILCENLVSLNQIRESSNPEFYSLLNDYILKLLNQYDEVSTLI
jgi:hypothetical protein